MGKIRYVTKPVCPICGNELSYNVIHSRKFNDVKCPFCGAKFDKTEIIWEKSNDRC